MSEFIEHSRQDLQAIPGMLELGFIPQFSFVDEIEGRTSPDNPPAHGVDFIHPDHPYYKIVSNTTRLQPEYSLKSEVSGVHLVRSENFEEIKVAFAWYTA